MKSGNLPDTERLSILIATILLAYATAHFVDLPSRDLSFEFAGIFLPVQITVNTAVALIVSGMTAIGMDWLLREHPRRESGSTISHWVLPALTAWVVSVPLGNLPLGPIWWAAFMLGGLLLLLVLTAEYITADPNDIRQPVAAAGLTALSFMLFLVLSVSLRSLGVRLLIVLPATGLTVGLVSLRSIHLQLHGSWEISKAIAIILIVVQFAAAFHYLPITPISYGVLLLGLVYALINFLVNLHRDQTWRLAIIDPLFILGIMWTIAIIFR
ncbi:MAG: hypothetical protein FVQ83_07425 [Chloroflexi bacterium]|nr:hypothetical protein [Chloroflexota bacterium]